MQKELLTRPSKKQRELLEFIKGFVAQHGYGPSYREIMRALDYRSVSTVAVHVDGLIAKGHLEKRDRSARSLAVVDAPSKTAASETIKSSDAKWLVATVDSYFVDYDAAPTQKKLDALYILVGSLHVLGLEDAATSFKSRLQTLAKTE